MCASERVESIPVVAVATVWVDEILGKTIMFRYVVLRNGHRLKRVVGDAVALSSDSCIRE